MLKKTISTLLICLFVVAIFFIQLFVINSRELFGVKPNLILITVIVVSLWYGVYRGTFFSFLIGLISDFVFGNMSGMFTIAYTITGAITGVINDNYRKENKMSLVYVTLIFTAIFELIEYFEYLMLTYNYTNILYFVKQVIVSSLLNTIIVFILYSVIYRIMNLFESDNLNDRII